MLQIWNQSKYGIDTLFLLWNGSFLELGINEFEIDHVHKNNLLFNFSFTKNK